jgi:hypothetical protein
MRFGTLLLGIKPPNTRSLSAMATELCCANGGGATGERGINSWEQKQSCRIEL